jgi:hypothetical protein
MSDTDRDRNDPEGPEDLKTGGYPAMPPLDAVDPDLEQEGEKADPPDSGWGGAARAAEGETDRDRDR